jgi:phage terminase large subunit
VLREKADRHRWIGGRHFFPHDVAHRELSNRGLSRVDTLRSLGITATVLPQHNVNDGINATRRLLDIAWIDPVRCERGLNALRNYRREGVEKLKAFRDSPRHDWSSHGADALRTFATGYRERKERAPIDLTPTAAGFARQFRVDGEVTPAAAKRAKIAARGALAP